MLASAARWTAVLVGLCCVACADDLSGSLPPPSGFYPARFCYTADQPLSPGSAVATTLVGRRASVRPSGGNLTARNVDTDLPASRTILRGDGSFIVEVDAQLGDRVELTYVVDSETYGVTYPLLDPLDTISRPVAASALTARGQVPGFIETHLENLVSPEPPYLVYNPANGSSASANGTEHPVILHGDPGESSCVFRLGPSGSSVSACEISP